MRSQKKKKNTEVSQLVSPIIFNFESLFLVFGFLFCLFFFRWRWRRLTRGDGDLWSDLFSCHPIHCTFYNFYVSKWTIYILGHPCLSLQDLYGVLVRSTPLFFGRSCPRAACIYPLSVTVPRRDRIIIQHTSQKKKVVYEVTNPHSIICVLYNYDVYMRNYVVGANDIHGVI